MLTSVPRILFIDLTNRPGSDRTIAAMARLGAECAVLGPARSFAARSRYAGKVFWLPMFASRWIARLLLRARLGTAVRDWRPDILIPLDPRAACALRDPHLAAQAMPALRALIKASLGSAVTSPLSGDPEHLRALARELGIRTGSGASIAAKTPTQTLVRVVACADGKVLDGISYRTVQVDPRSGDGTVLYPIDRLDMDEAARTLVAALGCTGLVSLRFALNDKVEFLSLEEGAPAAGLIGRLFGHDIHEALLDHFRGRPAPAPRPRAEGPTMIALFPHELDRDPASRSLNVPYILHDLPWDDLAMMDIYAKWLRRRHPRSATQLRRHLPTEGLPTTLDVRKLVENLERYP